MSADGIDLNDCRTTGRRNKNGYGQMSLKGKTALSHRVAYCSYHKIPLESIDGMVVRHKCDNPPCINPEHLEIGTIADNNRDAKERGRLHKWKGARKGEGNPRSKLTRSEVEAIRARHKPRSRTDGSSAIAREYNLNHRTIVDIISRRTWK
jgi:hypothetical protein